MKKLLFIIIVLGIFYFSSCSFGPDFQKPDVQSPQSFVYDSVKVDSVVNVKWWDLFNDSVLDSLVITALNENKNINIALSRIEEARATLGFTKADMYPNLGYQIGAGRGNYAGGQQFPNAVNNFYVTPTVSWEIDFWGKFRRSNESARAAMMANIYSLRSAQVSLIAEVVGTYFLLLDYKQRLEISERTLESRLKSLDIIQQRFDRGIVPEIDLNQAQIQKEIAAASIPAALRSVSKTEHALSILLGRNPQQIEVGKNLVNQTVPPPIPIGLPSTLLERRPDIAEAEYLFKSQNARIGVAEAMRWPSFSITGILGVAGDDISALSTGNPAWSIGGSLLGPIFEWGKNLRRVEIEEERTKQALLSYENTVLNAFREVEDALVETITYQDQVEAKERQVKAAKNAAMLSSDRYNGGVTSYLEVLETERTLFTSELELSQAKQEYLNSYIRLYKALGGGWITKEEQAESEKQ